VHVNGLAAGFHPRARAHQSGGENNPREGAH
jgi:hypothetical protein